jgi:ABC-type arginine transport system permease subunit
MGAKRWLTALGVVLLVEVVVALVLSLIAMEENCNNGIARWQCSESLQDLFVAILIGLPLFYVLALVVFGMRAWVERNGG